MYACCSCFFFLCVPLAPCWRLSCLPPLLSFARSCPVDRKRWSKYSSRGDNKRMRSSARFPAPRRRVPVFSCRLCHEPGSRKHNARVCGVSKSKWRMLPVFCDLQISLIADGEGKRKKMLLAVSSGKQGRKIFVSRQCV